VTAPGQEIWPGKRQPYRAFLDEVKRKLLALGFREMSGPLIETEFWNFDALYQPQNHPARDWAATYSLAWPSYGKLPAKKLVARVKAAHERGWTTGSTGWGYRWSARAAARLMPRAHGTCLSARTLAAGVLVPGKYFAIARCYRPDVMDVMHLIEFNQVEGIVVDESLTFRHLLGILKLFALEFGKARKVRFFPAYFPFTEPSVELFARHPELGWVELGGAGIFRPELTEPLGVHVPVIAWGLGVDRLAMCQLRIRDIRQLFSQDLGWLRKK
jgi:phenylalanyl-tRNA synthetase alpha chain